jgi:hypothetical protein
MAERRMIREYREAPHEMASPRKEGRRKSLAGKAAKLGAEIYGEERKAKPKTKGGAKPRR